MLHLKGETILYPLPKEERVQRYEKFWELRFPEDYRQFLMKYNGVEPVEKSFEVNGYENPVKGKPSRKISFCAHRRVNRKKSSIFEF